MAFWTNLINAIFLPGRPILGSTGVALRDNMIAIAEGAAGAPRIEDAALDTTVTTAGQDWVAARMVARTHGGVGTLVTALRGAGSGNVAFGATIAGSSISPCSLGGDVGGSLVGTWWCLGIIPSSPSGMSRAALWQRIA